MTKRHENGEFSLPLYHNNSSHAFLEETNEENTVSVASNDEEETYVEPDAVGKQSHNNWPRNRSCSVCGTTSSPHWRREKTTGNCLCNACGIRQYLSTSGCKRTNATGVRSPKKRRMTTRGKLKYYSKSGRGEKNSVPIQQSFNSKFSSNSPYEGIDCLLIAADIKNLAEQFPHIQ